MADTYTIERSSRINAPREKIFDKIVHFRQWPDWSPWEDLDPDMEKAYTGNPDGQVGSGYKWKGNRKAGEGSMELTAIDAPRAIQSDLHFLKPFKSDNTLQWDLQTEGDGTLVTWTMVASHSLMTRVMSAFGLMERMVGKDFEKGLARLKKLSEA